MIEEQRDYKVELSNTAELMSSPNWKSRLKAEYWQLKIRIEKLEKALLNNNIQPDDAPIFQKQLDGMHSYMDALDERIKRYNLMYVKDPSDMIEELP